tara:strand:- start:1370 stop:2092 length:723 start_codon:yes stop_codon:yes gene_type:complete
MFQTRKIVFSSSYADALLAPVPIKKIVPSWFKEMPGTLEDLTSRTVKKCVPFLDTLTSGYAILNSIDIHFKKSKDGNEIKWASNESFPFDSKINVGLQAHGNHQISKSMIRDDEDSISFKYLNPWKIETPKNYSCLFTNPFNYSNERKIRILDGIVDTDSYKEIFINFPFFIKKLNNDEEYVLKRGEPIALVFPFMRDDWKMKINKNYLSEKELNLTFMKYFSNIFDNYRSNFWKRKKYD